MKTEICTTCKGDKIRHNAWATHSPLLGHNVLERTHDDPIWCEDCDTEVQTEMVDVLRYKVEREYSYGWDDLRDDEQPIDWYDSEAEAQAEINDITSSTDDDPDEYRIVSEPAPATDLAALKQTIATALTSYCEDSLSSDEYIMDRHDIDTAWQTIQRALNQ